MSRLPNPETRLEQKIRPEWADVMNETLWIKLEIGRWRARVQTDWNQLGLPAAPFQRAFTPGMRKLLPDQVSKELDQLEQMARDLLKRVSFETLFGAMIPKVKYFEFKQWLTEIPLSQLRSYLYKAKAPDYIPMDLWQTTPLFTRWFQLRDEICFNRDRIVDEVIALYDDALLDVWNRRNKGGDYPAIFEAWMDEKKRQIAQSIPSTSYIRESFVLRWTLGEVEAPPDVIKAAKLDELNQREADLRRAIVEAETKTRRLERERELARVQLDRQITEEISRIRADAGEQFNTVINQIIGELHGQIYTMILDQLEYLDKNEGLHARSVGRIKNLVSLVSEKLVGLTDETSLRQACEELKRLAESGYATKSDAKAHVQAQLRKIGIDMKLDLLAAGVPSRSGRSFGIPDDIADIEVIRAERQVDMLSGMEPEPVAITREARQIEMEPIG